MIAAQWTVGVVGVGLVGGSLVKAIKARSPSTKIVAIEPRDEVRASLISNGLSESVARSIDEGGSVLGTCDLVVMCAPIAAIERMMGPVSARMKPGSTLTDVAGSKASLLAVARRDCVREVTFVGAHPMFGGPTGGFEASRADRWEGGIVAVCTDEPHTDRAAAERGSGCECDGDIEDAIGRVESLHRALGATVVRCTAEAHDEAVAWVSHLPYVIACALEAVSPRGGLSAALAGRSFRDATRAAQFADEIQGDVARRNVHLRAAIAHFSAELAAWSEGESRPENA